MKTGEQNPLEARYANYFAVGDTVSEVVFEFGQFYEGSEPLLHTRIVTSKPSAREFLTLLKNSLEQQCADPEAPHE